MVNNICLCYFPGCQNCKTWSWRRGWFCIGGVADSDAEAGSWEGNGGVWATTACWAAESGRIDHCPTEESPTQQVPRGRNESWGVQSLKTSCDKLLISYIYRRLLQCVFVCSQNIIDDTSVYYYLSYFISLIISDRNDRKLIVIGTLLHCYIITLSRSATWFQCLLFYWKL